MADLLSGCRTIGIEDDHLNLSGLQALQTACPDVTTQGLADAIAAARMIKSAEEIVLIREGARVAD